MRKTRPQENITFKNHMNPWGQGVTCLSDLFPTQEYVLYFMEFGVELPPLGDSRLRRDRLGGSECHH